MSAVAARESCLCGLEVREEIWLCPHHRYFRMDREYESVSKVIKTVFPTDYSGIDPITLEVARLRGVFVDSYFSDWLKDPSGVVPLSDVALMVAPEFPRDQEKNSLDTANRIERVCEWWQKSGMVAKDVQRIVYSDSDGIAGTFDLGTAGKIIDLKNTYKLEASYMLQLGGYLYYGNSKGDRDPAILHVTKDKVRLVPYDGNKCVNAWKVAAAWYRTMKEL